MKKTMEIQIKKTVRAGNSSAVILPRAWLNKEVRIELVKKTNETILCEAINILKEYIGLGEIIGIYLVGSYAREEEDENSDIDILAITKNTDRDVINEGIYSILLVSEELLNQKLRINLFPVGQMIKEAKPLINSSYLDKLEIKITKSNVKWYLDTTKDKLELIRQFILEIKDKKAKVSDSVAYTLVLRMRTLYIIKQLIQSKKYLKKDLIHIIKRVSGGNEAYEGYLAVKNNNKDKNRISLEEVEKMYGYLKKQLEEVKNSLK